MVSLFQFDLIQLLVICSFEGGVAWLNRIGQAMSLAYRGSLTFSLCNYSYSVRISIFFRFTYNSRFAGVTSHEHLLWDEFSTVTLYMSAAADITNFSQIIFIIFSHFFIQNSIYLFSFIFFFRSLFALCLALHLTHLTYELAWHPHFVLFMTPFSDLQCNQMIVLR